MRETIHTRSTASNETHDISTRRHTRPTERRPLDGRCHGRVSWGWVPMFSLHPTPRVTFRTSFRRQTCQKRGEALIQKLCFGLCPQRSIRLEQGRPFSDVSKGHAGRCISAASSKSTCGAATITAQLETRVAFPVSNQAAAAAVVQAWNGSTAAACAAEAHTDAVAVSVQARHGGTEASSAIEFEAQPAPVAAADPQSSRNKRTRQGFRLVGFSFAGSVTQLGRRARLELRIHRRWRF